MMSDEVTAHFDVDGEGLDVTIGWMEEQPDGFSFKLEGRRIGSDEGRQVQSDLSHRRPDRLNRS